MLTHSTILFDMDGTIFDTLLDTAAAVNHVCRHYGLPERTIEQVSAGMGRGVSNLVKASLPEGFSASASEVLEVYREFYDEHYLDNSRPYDGIIELLTALKAAGAKTAVISNKVHEYTQKIVDELYNGYIDVCIGETPGVPLKPDPAPVRLALERLGASAESAVYVGDTEVDMQTARNSGIACITCAWGLRGREFLLENGADPKHLADTPADVLRILEGN